MLKEVMEVTCPCMMPGIEEFRQLVFPDGGKVRVKGLNRLFEIAYREEKKPDKPLAGELVEQLSENNYIPSNEHVRLEYTTVILKEYQMFIEAKKKNKGGNTPQSGC